MSDQELAEASDAALLARIREGDTSAYGPLYERHVGAARSLARQLVRSDAEVDDVVSETFAKVLDLLQRGGGPTEGFRPYLLTSVRRGVYDRYRGEKRQLTTGEIELYDPGVPFTDPALEGLERSMILRAFQSMPERWQTILWHTEIEGAKPAEVAPMLGLTPNGAAALAYRAREGLRQAYLQMHLAQTPRQECRPTLEKLGAYVRGGLAKRESAVVENHLDGCADCKAIYAELADVNTSLRTIIGPLVLGTAATAYLAAGKGGFGLGGIYFWWKALPKRQQQLLGGGTAGTVAVAAVAGLLLVSGDEKTPVKPAAKPPAAAPPAVPPAKPPAKPPAPPPAPPPANPPAAAPVTNPPADRPARPARLSARIDPVGTLSRDRPGIVALDVRNGGKGKSDDMVADVGLPSGVSYPGTSGGRSPVFRALAPPGGGWTCRARPSGARCSHSPLGPGTTTLAYLHVEVGAEAPYGDPPTVTLRSGGTEVKAKGETGVRTSGLPARYATVGHVATVAVGNASMSCRVHHEPQADATPGKRPEPKKTGETERPRKLTDALIKPKPTPTPTATKPGRAKARKYEPSPAHRHADECAEARKRQGDQRDNDLWHMKPLDLDDNSSTENSSSARLSLPGRVLWAGLYWSGSAKTDGRPTARIRMPGASSYSRISAAETSRAELPSHNAYQAFADVTGLVRRGGAGQWWVADVPAKHGAMRYAGWSLVVVARDPDASLKQAMVLDGTRVVTSGSSPFAVPIAGLLPAAVPAKLNVVAWEGDADLSGDRVLLDGRPLTPAGGDRDAGNAFDSSAQGAVGPALTFGVDVKPFSATLGKKQTLSLTTSRDAYLTGVVTVTAPMRS